MPSEFISIYLKFFFLLTPFFVLSAFLILTDGKSDGERKRLSLKVTFAALIACVVLLFLGEQVFNLFNITLNSFRIGTGVLLMLSAVNLVQGSWGMGTDLKDQDISVVPLAIPITVGPATTGAILVMGSEMHAPQQMIIGFAALASAILSVGFLLFISGTIEKILKRRGLAILSKVTGLVLSALSAEMIMTGIKDYIARL